MTTTQPINYDVKEATIMELSITRDNVLAEYKDNKNIDAVKKAKREVGKLRIAIDKRRKEYKAEALEYGRQVDALAKEAREPVVAIEDSYGEVIAEYDAELERVIREAAEKEEARIATIQERIKAMESHGTTWQLGHHSVEQIHMYLKEFENTYVNDSFDYAEFKELAGNTKEKIFNVIKEYLLGKMKFEKELAEREARHKINEESRIKFEAEKAEFEATQREANAKLQAERDAIEAEKKAAIEKQHAEERAAMEKEHAIKMQEAKEQLEKQRVIDEEKRKVAEAAEKSRLEQIAKEELDRKLAQEKEDRVRNAAPELMEALRLLLSCDLRHSLVGGYGYQIETAESAYIDAGGDLNNLEINEED